MTIWLIVLLLGAYLLGSLPVSHLAAKFSRGIDLRRYGTGQVGAGNLWRMTASWKIGLAVVLFDLTKGMAMVGLAKLAGLTVAQHLVVGLATIIGHNWSIFLRFTGGRGVGTTIGIILIIPIINDMSPWTMATFLIILISGAIIMRSSPIPILLGTAAVPIVSRWLDGPSAVTLGYLAIFLIIVLKRLTAPRSADAASLSQGQLLLNRFLFDRDIRDRKGWMYRKPLKQEGQKKG